MTTDNQYPEKVAYRNNPKKALAYIGVGFLMTVGSLIVPLMRIVVFIIGLAVFFTGLGALIKRKPQIILDQEGIYIGFKVKEKLPWKIVDATSVRKEKIDDRMVWFLSVKTKQTKRGVIGYNVYQANLDLLKIDRDQLLEEINHFKSL